MNGAWCGPGGRHLLVMVYTRPWRRFFRKTNELRCWECDLIVRDPYA